MRYTFFFLLLASGFLASLSGQTLLTLEECVGLARAQSPAARIASMNMGAQRYDYHAFQAGFLPQMSLSADLPGLDRSISSVEQPDGSLEFRSRSIAYSSVNLNVNQQIAATGGRIFLSTGLFNRLNLADTRDVTWQSNLMVIGIQQPLFQVNRMRWDRQEQSMAYELARIDYLQAVETAARQAMEVFFDVLLAQINVANAEVNVRNNDTIFQISQGRFEVGNIAENDLLQSEMSLLNAWTALESSTLAYDQAIARLKVMLGLPKEESIRLEVPTEVPVITAEPSYAVAQALAYSRLLQAAELQRLQAERDVALARQDNRPNANLTASFGLNQSGVTVKEAYQSPLDRESFNIGFEMPILQWGRGKDQIEAARLRSQAANLSLEQSRANFENDVYFQMRNLQQLSNQLTRVARGDTIAQRRYAVTKSRYLVGKVEIQALFIAQNERDGARELYAAILRSYWLALARLRESTLYDFVRMEPIEWEIP